MKPKAPNPLKIAPEQMACACHGKSLLECPILNPQDPQAALKPAKTPKEPKMAKKAKTQVHRRQFEMEVRTGLTPEEQAPLVKDLTNALKDADQLKQEAKETASAYRAKLNAVKETIDELALTIDKGKPEMTMVEETRNFTKNTLTIKRVDNGEVVEQRDMNADDNQIPISDLPNAEEPADGAPAED